MGLASNGSNIMKHILGEKKGVNGDEKMREHKNEMSQEKKGGG